MALRPVAKGQHAASVQNAANAMWNNAVKVVAARVVAKDAAHAKTATAVDAVKIKLTSTTTPHLKRKPKHEPKHATSAWPAKNAAKALKAVKEVKAVANAAHAANATTTAANAALAKTKTAIQKPCRSTTRQAQTAKRHKPKRTVASVVSAAHETVTAVTAASVVIAHRVKKALQIKPTTAKLLSATTRQTSKRRKKLVSHANHVNHVSLVSNVVNVPSVQNAKNATSDLTVQTAPLVKHRVKKHKLQRQRPKPLHAKACRTFKPSHCLWHRCKQLHKAAVWNGSTPIQTALPPCKPPLQPSPSPCMCRVSAHRW